MIHSNQGNLGAGIYGKFVWFSLEAGTYAAETEVINGIGTDRRYYVQLAVDI